jgi:hypothetical protein
MAHMARAIEAEHHFRQLLHRGGLPQPDAVEYHETEVLFLWHESKAAVVVELEDARTPREPHVNRGQG